MPRHWLFGYGSILSEASRLATLAADSSEEPSLAAVVEISAAAGFVREWNFRAPSGFTAVGLRRSPETATAICGVLFEVGSDCALGRFDAREKGYDRVQLEPSQVSVLDGHAAATAELERARARRAEDAIGVEDHLFWVYVPRETQPASDEFPICQTYVDVCLSGCLERGGHELANRWVVTTGGWSQYWLNDAPMSRRPWLHRPRHAEVDAVLKEHAERTRFDERRHPEDYSGRWSGSLRGMWGVPPRNSAFVGRAAELGRVGAALRSGGGGGGGGGGEGRLTTLELVGMGGVGKTQLATEYCYRSFAAASQLDERPSAAAQRYGLVAWLRAESAEALAADLRSLANDSGIGVQGMRNDEVVSEVRARLYRTHTNWLLVFDNVTSASFIGEQGLLPRGCMGTGHVLITSRTYDEARGLCSNLSSVLQLGCFSTTESLALLRGAGGEHLGVDDLLDLAEQNGEELMEMRGLRGSMTELELEGLRGERGDQGGREPLPNEKQPTMTAGMLAAAKLGHLPLALALAAAYMRACDVSCADYFRRLSSGEYPTALGMSSPRRRRPNGGELLQGYEQGVAESFELSLAQLDEPMASSSGGAAALGTSEIRRRSLSGEFIHGSSARSQRIGAVSTRQVLDVLSFCASEGIPKAFVTAVVLGTAACEEVPPPVVPPPVEERGSSGLEAEGKAMAKEVRPAAQPSTWTGVAVACGVLSISAAVLAAAAPQRRRRAALVISALAAGLAAAAATACSTARAAADATEATTADATEAVASAVGQIAATPHAAASSAQGSTKEREVDRDSFDGDSTAKDSTAKDSTAKDSFDGDSTAKDSTAKDSTAKDSFDDVQRLPAHTAFPTAPSCPMAAHPLLLPADTEVFDGMNAEGEAQAVADRAWLRLKRFSLLTVREVRGERTGSAPLSLLACKGSP